MALMLVSRAVPLEIDKGVTLPELLAGLISSPSRGDINQVAIGARLHHR